jgi:nucleoid-associated protein YgaU
MVIAGRAEPNQTVDIMLSGQTLERVVADGSGSFVALPVAGPSDQPRRLSLMADPDGAAIPSQTSYIVAPIAAPVVVADVPAENTPTVAEAPAVLEDTNVAEVAPVITAPAAPPTVLQADADGVRVVQGPATEDTTDVALDAITYDPQGEVQLSGRATGDGAVQVYIDNQPAATSPVTRGGDWRIDLPDIDTGVYTLRIDEVDAAGDVVSRLETPFKREEASEVAAVLAEETGSDGFQVAVKTVQPGATLWAIAEENLGSGIYYVEVFEANSDLIRDPDLIYPGQIFRMPVISD